MNTDLHILLRVVLGWWINWLDKAGPITDPWGLVPPPPEGGG